ncbi:MULTISPECIES: NlpC/P60 family protein [Methylosinus]|uniref:Peptidase P60 n=1 Tax=Methylosinus trichosporium (strain ATCC 35070 / NCIMB 11131 / UNIQEM 75 / OB3b) TaxID=595536 RepID=A0A2D2CWT4_METT3|nr:MULTISPECIES: NlpC/P60 family protein [Methylosinus]ATQ67144.1 peptidase P60 [Methylosinus trichosporium OB3b]OBS52705.1 peptidase P60 [Methylosinus sp. 3S-1]
MSAEALSRAAIVAEARRWVGTPYRHQASLIHVGCDCLGLVRGVWRALIGPEPEEPPPYTPDWAETRGEETLALAAHRHFIAVDARAFCAGDVLLFRFRDGAPAKHLGIATDAAHMVHAHGGACVAEAPIGLWRRRVVAAFAFPGVSD